MTPFRKILLIILAAITASYFIKLGQHQQKQAEQKKEMTLKGDFLHIKATNTSGTIYVNYVPIYWLSPTYKNEERGDWHFISLTPWLLDMNNKITMILKESDGKANQPNQSFAFKALFTKLPTVPTDNQKSDFEKKITRFDQYASGTIQHILNADIKMPPIFMKGATGPHDLSALTKTIKQLHKAYRDKNFNLINQIEAPLFKDMDRLSGRENLASRQQRKSTILKGQVPPLTLYPFQSFYEGRLIYAGGPNGQAPINIQHFYGGGGWQIKTGRYWSKIDGHWRVVR